MRSTLRRAAALAALLIVGSARAEEPSSAPPAAPAASPTSTAEAPPPAAAPAARVAAPAPATAPGDATRPLPVRLVMSARYDFGLNDAVRVQYQNGRTDALRTNGGWVLAAGAAYRPPGSRFEAHATFGVKYDSIQAANGSVRYLAFPLELLAGANVRPFRLSAGAAFTLWPSYKGSGAASGLDATMKSGVGIVGQAEWVGAIGTGGATGSLGLRYTIEKTQLDAGGPTSDASTVGFVAGVTL